MKIIKYMLNIFFMTSCIITLISCDNNIYYKTFDYKSMTFLEPTTKSDHCIRYISLTHDKIEFEVLFLNNKVKRTFIKKEGYWYSKYKYKTVPVPGYGVTYGNEYEFEYYIFENHIIYKMYYSVIYLDLIEKEMYVLRNYKSDDFKLLNLEELISKDFKKIEFYTEDGILFKREKYFESGNFKEEVITDYSHFPANLDIFFWLDEEVYYPAAGVEPVYD